MILIAEIGNNHFGSIDLAKELISEAVKSGATLIKGQAIRAIHVTTGSMPFSFYKQCELTIPQYISLIEYSRSLGVDMFYSIFARGLDSLKEYQNYNKISGGQVKQGRYDLLNDDNDKTFVSFPFPWVEKFRFAQPLLVSDYLTKDPHLFNITRLQDYFKRPIGYSDHTEGIFNCLMAYKYYKANVIEKHFKLENQKTWNGQEFRDLIHSATPTEFKILAKELSR